MMIRHLAIAILAFLSARPSSAQPVLIRASVGAAQQEKENSSPAQPKAEAKKAEAALTGCVDEQDGQYVLIDYRTMNPIANLVADGFPTEDFAKHVGHKVTVRGTSSPGGARPDFKVRTIEPISDQCAPEQL